MAVICTYLVLKLIKLIQGWYYLRSLVSLPGWTWYKADIASGHTHKSHATDLDTICSPVCPTNTASHYSSSPEVWGKEGLMTYVSCWKWQAIAPHCQQPQQQASLYIIEGGGTLSVALGSQQIIAFLSQSQQHGCIDLFLSLGGGGAGGGGLEVQACAPIFAAIFV
jgi:hypothetical protein